MAGAGGSQAGQGGASAGKGGAAGALGGQGGGGAAGAAGAGGDTGWHPDFVMSCDSWNATHPSEAVKATNSPTGEPDTVCITYWKEPATNIQPCDKEPLAKWYGDRCGGFATYYPMPGYRCAGWCGKVPAP